MMKKILIILTSVIIILGSVSCNKKNKDVFNTITFHYFVPKGDTFTHVSEKAFLETGTTFSEKNTEILYSMFSLDGYRITKFFTGGKGFYPAHYKVPDDMPEGERLGNEISVLSDYFFAEDSDVFAYYINLGVRVTGVDLENIPVMYSTEQKVLYASIKPMNASNKNVRWEIINENRNYDDVPGDVARIDANGKLICMNPGTAEVYVETEDGKINTKRVLTVNEKDIALSIGGSIYFSLLIPSEYSDIGYEWTADSNAYFNINNVSGMITGIAAGKTRLVAKNTEKNVAFVFSVEVKNN